MRRTTALALAAALFGCGNSAAPRLIPVAAGSDWRRVATPGDRERLRAWRQTWQRALAAARRTAPEALAAQGALFDYDRALDQPIPPAGSYSCRVYKLGARQPGQLDYVDYPAFACRVVVDERGTVRLEKLTGSQRPTGVIFADNGLRAVFLGVMILGDEARPYPYGREPARDLAGWVERIGPARWRVALPQPAFESLLDVVELVPAG
ncbi:DUF4893 domain-containing protein [Sphingomonas sp. BK345]|uniref:DUF4893 domain-containing protein n=1 Tax=Sphingomonas sp. BK345 TaxID=2586980 RepID=UPI00160898A8|nr:DUF4893 domain-containing protein [Sphingomonas sp. BK345]MBB3472809.1 hypothetical protein [Sphingomonas sp. BK345]